MTPTSTQTPALQLVDLEVPFGGEPGLEPISLEVRHGERLVLVGASGAGKTTLLRAIAGLSPAAGGRMHIGGVDSAGVPAEARNAIYLRQTPVLFPHLTVFENVAFALRVRRVARSEVRLRVEQALAAVQLEDLGRRRPATLSGGQAQRVALARAIVSRPALLLLDEPLSALDPTLRDEVRQSIVRVAQEYGPGLVVVTHDLDEAGLLADRIGVIIDRKLEQIDAPAELFGRPASLPVARFLGIPNQVSGVLESGGRFTWSGGTLQFPESGRPGPATAVFRGDALRPDPSGPLRGIVTALLHRGHHTAALIATAGHRLEMAVDSMNLPALNTELSLTLDSRRILVFPT
jgi:ABC-type sugar transport system ATPase subunit